MIRINIEDILPNLFNLGNKENEDVVLISLLTMKSLVPIDKGRGNRIDYKRFNEELKLWKYYRVGDNTSILNILDDIDEEIYFNSKDNIIYSRILPIILANQRYEIIEDEIIKNILFISGNIESLLEWMLVGKFLHLILNNEDNIIDELKEYIINISQVDFLNSYKDFYRFKLDERLKDYKIEFERTRVNLISILNGIPMKKYKYIEDIFRVFNDKDPERIFGSIIYYSLLGKDLKIESSNFYNNMNEYILKLRKGRIDPKSLIIKEYILPDIFKYEEGDVFLHSLVNESKIIKKEVKNGISTSLVKSRSGMYLFREARV